MNKLTTEARAQNLHLLCEGMSIRAVTQLTGVSKNTVAKLLLNAGGACAAFHDERVRGVKASRIQCDEIWSFTYAKEKDVADFKAAPEDAGNTWTWTAIDADTKLIVSWLLGGRDSECALKFIDDLRSRLANRVRLTTDGHRAYLSVIEEAFGDDIDYAMLVKLYGEPTATHGHERKCSPSEWTGTRKRRMTGNPDKAHVGTSYAGRQNLAMRMHMRRFTRPTNAFSKKTENHHYAVALHLMYYNFVRVHSKLRMTPAMAAGVANQVWEIADIVKLVEAAESAPKRHGP